MLFRRVFPFLPVLLVVSSLISFARSDTFVEQLRRDVIGKRENDPERNKRLAILLERHGLPEDAILYYRRAVELDPLSIDNKRKLARCLAKLDRTDEALEIYQTLFEINPKDHLTATNLISLLEECGRIEEAESIFLRLISETEDIHLRLAVVSRLADMALRHQRIEEILKTVSGNSQISDPCEKALLLSQIYIQCGRLTEAFHVLEEEYFREESMGVTPNQLLLDHLIDTTFSTDNAAANMKYCRIRATFYSTDENLKEAEESQNRYHESFDTQKKYYRADPSLFLSDLPQLLLIPKTRDETISFAFSFIPEIPAEQIAESFDVIPPLFRETLFSRQEYQESAIKLWKQLLASLTKLPRSEKMKAELYVSLVGIAPDIGKSFSDEMTKDFLFLLNEDVLWKGYWSSEGWNSLLGTILRSVSDLDAISNTLNSNDRQTTSTDDIRRAKTVLLFYRRDYSEQTYELLRSLNLLSPQTKSLDRDWTLFHEMKNDSNPFLQRDLTEAYRARLPLVVGTPDEHFVISEYRKAAIASGDSDLIEAAVAPMLKSLERNFQLAAQTNSAGNATTIDPNTGATRIINIYEILIGLLDVATELKSLGLSKEVAAMYHHYGKGKDWWINQEGQGVFYFEELKNIVSESE